MRIFILYCAFFIAILGLRAQQSFNKAYHGSSQIAAPFVLSLGGSYFHISKVKNSSSEANQAFLYKHANDSTLKFIKPIIQNKKLDINHAFVTKDKAIMVLCNDSYCGLYSSSMGNSYLVKLDSIGNQVFKTSVNRGFMIAPQGGQNGAMPVDVGVIILDRFKTGFQNMDSTYMIFTDSVMYKFSSQGIIMSRKNLGMDSITAALLLPNNTILVNGHVGSQHNLFVIYQSGQVISASPFQATLKKILYYNGTKMLGLATNGNLYKISSNYSLIANTNYSFNTKITDFLCAKDTIYTCRVGPNSTSSFFACDTNFNTIYNSIIVTKSLSPVAICKYNQKIVFIANSTSDDRNPLGQNYFSSISVFNKSSAPLHNFNIELSNVSVDTSYYTINWQTGSTTSFNLYLRVKFYAKNKGNTPIKRFKFTCGTSPYGPICGVNEYYQQSFSGLNILPGDSIQLKSGTIYRYATLNNSGYSYPGIPQVLCVFLTVPNDEVDNDQSNNEKCVTEGYNGLGISEFHPLEKQILIFPNPSNSYLNLESVQPILNLTLSNAIGQQVIQIQNPEKSIKLETSQLNNGIYILKVETAAGTLTKKIIKN